MTKTPQPVTSHTGTKQRLKMSGRLVIPIGSTRHITYFLALWLISFWSNQIHAASPGTIQLTVNFPGLSSVHTAVKVSDGISGTATGNKIAHANWKKNQVQLSISPGIYDLEIRRGSATIIVDDVDCTTNDQIINTIVATLTVNFPGLSSVHTAVFPTDGVDGTTSADKVTHANWKKNQAIIPVFRQVYDLKVQKGASTITIDNVDCTSGDCTVDNIAATLTVNFSGLSSVHTDVLVSDGVAETASGKKATHANWKKNQAIISVLAGTYDLKIRRGKATVIVDNVDCTSGDCTVDNIATTMTVNFPGLSSVHTDVLVSDGTSGTISENKVTHANWKKNETTITVFRQVYDLKIRQGSGMYIVDDVDCTTGDCSVDNIVRTMTVNFPGQSSIHTEVRLSDGNNDTASGKKVTHKNWQKDQAILNVLPLVYDLKIKKGSAVQIIDNVDCTAGDCTVDLVTRDITVKFPGLSGVHTAIMIPDGVNGTATGNKVTHKNWQKDQTTVQVPAGIYDIQIRKGASTFIVDNVNCTSDNKVLDDITAQLTVKFPGLRSVHTDVLLPDFVDGTVSEDKLTHKNWQKDQAVITVFREVYDLKVRKGGIALVIDEVDCTSGECTVEGLSSTMTVKFLGMSGVHTDILLPDGVNGTATGAKVTHKNWQKDQAVITIPTGKYDVKIRQGKATFVVDNVDCANGDCTVDSITATMTVKFPGMSSVHTKVVLADGVDGTASQEEVTHKNWQKNEAEITVFRQNYDLSIRKGKTTHIVDNVDCTNGECLVDGITAQLKVNFSGLSSVHTSVFVPDSIDGTVSGDKVTHKNWQKNEAVIPVFRQKYDLEIRRGKGKFVVDNVDCTTGDCTVDNITASMTVKFPGMSGVHTKVVLADGVDGTASQEEVTHKNWQKDEAKITVFRQNYDLSIRKGGTTHIVDNVDCTNGECIVDDVAAVLTVEFPGLSGVHTSVFVPDSVDGTVSGDKVTHKNWQNHKTNITVFRQIYDVKVRHQATTIFDNIDCTSGVCLAVVRGNSQVTLVDDDNNLPLPGRHLRAYEKRPNGTLSLAQKGVTNDEGKVHFTLEGLGKGKIYVLKTWSPFENSKTYFSPLITKQGPFAFSITRDGEFPLDLVPPQLTITTPTDGNSVSITGFEVTGFTTDNNEIDRVVVTVDDPDKEISTIAASYNEANGSWSVTILPSMISINPNIAINATAFDRAQNEATQNITVVGILDTTGPVISITSHTNNDTVPVTGFLLSGTVDDQTSVETLFATLIDPIKGKVIDNQSIGFFTQNGTWTLAVSNGFVTENQTVTISLTATDQVNNSSTIATNLKIVAADNTGRNMINRITFGATPQLLLDVQFSGALGYLNQQLSPDAIDDSEFEALIPGVPTTKEDLKVYTVLHMIHSKRQLNEVMTWFWDNHFNTFLPKTGNQVSYEFEENELFRLHALGNFRELLEVSAKSPAMLYYLDSVKNVATDANENYAREVMELHTMGVDGGYTFADVEAAAEIFTGWGVEGDTFFFDMDNHNPEEQTFLGEIIPFGDLEQGERLLDTISRHRSTAEFICKKLITLFVSDTPPESLVQRAADVFESTFNAQDQIAQVVRTILTSPEFSDNYRKKTKTPIELIVGFVRNLNAGGNSEDLPGALQTTGLNLYEHHHPDGYSETGDDWTSSNQILERIKWVNQIAINRRVGDGTYIEPTTFFSGNGFETAEGIVGYILNLAFGDDFTDLERNTALQLLNEDGEFVLSAPGSEQKLRQMIGLVLSYPGYQYQ